MTDDLTRRVALIGFPEAGKTTFVAALWNQIQHPAAECVIELATRPARAAYLEEIHRIWLEGKKIGHTPRELSELISLDVTIDEQKAVLEIPDLSGEWYDEALMRRRLGSEVAELLVKADGLVVFVNPVNLRPRLTILEAQQLGADLTHAPSELDRQKLPAEVQVIDLLQSLFDYRVQLGKQLLPRVALVVSAWDRVVIERLSPRQWVAHRMPMLEQFVQSQLSGAIAVFGVSAQGGDDEKDDLAAMDPARRAYVVGDLDRTFDMSVPIVWLLRS